MDQPLFIGTRCIETDKTDSTNRLLAEMAADGNLPEGTLVITRDQTGGRGQRGTRWDSEPGKNLTVSILLRPAFLDASTQFQLSKCIALGVHDFVSGQLGQSADRVSVKWPNDIYIGTRKTSGILIENSISGTVISQSIVGIGLNVNQTEFGPELPDAVSLKLATGRAFDLADCLHGLCRALERRYLRLRSNVHAPDQDYQHLLFRRGEWASYTVRGRRIGACITGVTGTGLLELSDPEGNRIRCEVKDVVFEK